MRHAVCATILSVAASFLLLATAAHCEETNEGFRYVLHSATPPEDRFDGDPGTFIRVTDKFVWQGPEQTLIWATESNVGDLATAGFARGQRRMGLLVPFWDHSRSAAEESGWSDYGRAVEYKAFDVKIRPGDRGRTIAGAPAAHYRIDADLLSRQEGSSADQRIQLSSDVWIHEDKPFTWAPFATAGMFGEPRLQVALYEKLTPLGMVVRAASVHRRQAQDEEGNPVGYGHDSTWLIWVTGLERAQVPEVHVPVARDETLSELRKAAREELEGACRTLREGGTPAFVARLLSEAQQAAFAPHLQKMCERRDG